MKKIDQDSIFQFNGKTYTMVQFAEAFANSNLEAAIGAVEQLHRKGRIKLANQDSKEQKIFDSVEREIKFEEAANEYDREVEETKDARAYARRQGRATYPEIELDYPTKSKMFAHKTDFMEHLRLTENQFDTKVNVNGYTMVIYNITDQELNYIQRTYKMDMGISNAISAMGSGANKVTDAVNYTADKVIAPAAQVAAKVGASVAKTGIKTATKVGASLFTALVRGVKEAAHDVRNDADVLRAGRELINAKDTVTRKINGFGTNAGGSGIRVKSE